MLRYNLLSQNEIDVARAKRVFATLVDALPKKLYPFQLEVLASSEVNAETVAGGFIVIYEGLLSQLRTDEELAAVLGHEIGHAAHRDYSRSVMDLRRNVIFGMFVYKNPEDFANFMSRERIRMGRVEESQADDFGTELYLRAGYDPTKVADAMGVLLKLNPDRGRDDYTDVHPPTAVRYKSIQVLRDQLLANGMKPVALLAEPPSLSIASIFGTLPAVKVESNAYFPLKEGMVWTYSVHAANSASGYTVSVVSVSPTDEGNIARLEMDLGASKVAYQCFTTADGVWRRNKPEKDDSVWTAEWISPSMFVPIAAPADEATPDLTGQPVTITDAHAALAGKWTFKDLGFEDVETPSGKYLAALKIEASDGVRTLNLWFAKGVGMVRRFNSAIGVDEVLSSIRIPS